MRCIQNRTCETWLILLVSSKTLCSAIMVECLYTIPALKSFNGAPQISVWDASLLANKSRGTEGTELKFIINKMGEFSASAQQLHSPITNFSRILSGSHKLYLLTSGIDGKPGYILAIGILKVGHKNLFIRRDNAHLKEIAPLCILDFYVHESCQRKGLGHKLFEHMLEQECEHACHLGYDKPSKKFLSFLAKHYNLSNYISQANQFVVYDDYFQDANQKAEREKENCQKDVSKPRKNFGTISIKDSALHGQRSNSRAGDENEYYFTRLDSNQFASAKTRSSLSVVEAVKQPCHHRGRRTVHWTLKENPEGNLLSAPLDSSNHLKLQAPQRLSLGKWDQLSAYGQELKDKGKSLNSKITSHSQTGNMSQLSKDQEAIVTRNNLCDQYKELNHRPPIYSIINEAERVKIQSLCSPSISEKMDPIQA